MLFEKIEHLKRQGVSTEDIITLMNQESDARAYEYACDLWDAGNKQQAVQYLCDIGWSIVSARKVLRGIL